MDSQKKKIDANTKGNMQDNAQINQENYENFKYNKILQNCDNLYIKRLPHSWNGTRVNCPGQKHRRNYQIYETLYAKYGPHTQT